MKVLVLFLALIVSPFTLSSEVIIGDNIQVLAVNGVKVSHSFFGENKINAEDGPLQIAVKYSKKFKGKSLLESKPYLFNIDVQGETKLETAKFTTYSRVKSYIKKQITWSVTNKKKQYSITDATQLKGKGFMPFSKIELIIKEHNQANDPTHDASPNNHQSNDLIEQYKAATQAQKDQFKTWLIQH